MNAYAHVGRRWHRGRPEFSIRTSIRNTRRLRRREQEALTVTQAIKKVLIAAPSIVGGIVGGLTCAAIGTLVEFDMSPFSNPEDSHETWAICAAITIYGVASGLASLAW